MLELSEEMGITNVLGILIQKLQRTPQNNITMELAGHARLRDCAPPMDQAIGNSWIQRNIQKTGEDALLAVMTLKVKCY
jgi:hypothetical protein